MAEASRAIGSLPGRYAAGVLIDLWVPNGGGKVLQARAAGPWRVSRQLVDGLIFEDPT